MDEDIRDFEISMNYVFFSQIFKSKVNVSDDGHRLFFAEEFLLADFCFQIAFITEFSNNVAITVTGKDFIALEYVGMVELFEYFNLRKEEFLQLFGLE